MVERGGKKKRKKEKKKKRKMAGTGRLIGGVAVGGARGWRGSVAVRGEGATRSCGICCSSDFVGLEDVIRVRRSTWQTITSSIAI